QCSSRSPVQIDGYRDHTRHAVPLLVVPSHTPYHQADPPSFKDGAMRLSSSAVSAALPGFCVLYGASAGCAGRGFMLSSPVSAGGAHSAWLLPGMSGDAA